MLVPVEQYSLLGPGATARHYTFYLFSIKPAGSFLKEIILLCIWLMIPGIASAQQELLTYDIIRKNQIIGTVGVTRFSNGNQSKYNIESHAAIRLFTDIKVDFYLSVTYLNSELVAGNLYKTINGNQRTNNRILKQPVSYRFINRGNDTIVFPGIINQSIATLYFKEPVAVNRVFSENFLCYVTLQAAGSGRYKVTLPDDHANYFTYKNGICTLVELETPLSTVFLKLKSTRNL